MRLAEDFATADILTQGRVIFGVGRGYHTREVETFGSPLLDQPANRDLFEEQVELIFKSFNERSFSHQGKYYNIPPRVPYRGYELEEITLVPRPRNLPVETWQPIQSATSRALDFMAKHSIKGMIGGGVSEGGAIRDVMEAYRDARVRAGREDIQLGEDLSIGFHFFLADTQEQAIKEAAKYYEENLKMFGPLRLVRSLSEEQIEAMGDPKRARSTGLPTMKDGVDAGRWLCGPPELIREQILAIQESLPGLEEINIGPPSGGVPEKVYLEQLEWFGREVMPGFKAQAKTAALAD
jgi:alkanesulfonate monooxygenase SsuD/methylene tetrahydromethanopterin reductase-like flavin-dependent oxidoreductase (luciferase family)